MNRAAGPDEASRATWAWREILAESFLQPVKPCPFRFWMLHTATGKLL